MDIILIMRIIGYALGFLSIVMGFILTLRIVLAHSIQPCSYIKGPLCLIMGFTLIASAHFLLPKLQLQTEKEKIQKEQEEVHLEKAIDEYTWYLDGREINPKTISIDDYKITYNDSDKIVTLSIVESKEDEDTTSTVCFIMIFIIFLWSCGLVNTRNGG